MLARYAVVATTSAAAGAYAYKEQDRLRSGMMSVLIKLGVRPASTSVDTTDAKAILATALRLARETPGSSAVLSTVQLAGGVTSRVMLMQDPFTIKEGADDSVDVYFNTTRLSRKYADLSRDGRASIMFWNPTTLAYVNLEGYAEELPSQHANELWRDWLRLFYKSHSDLYTAWRFRAKNIQVVSIGHLESTRRDWRAVEIEASVTDGWRVVCNGAE
eukprot:TRINITY_DN67987_c0_g1_i1.p1 TRINITY_DN67987_c0_g1~~TRINITY_DN67987_c0_g1_i1.p1  ORF type:complete len:233 (-),score=35.37 TRINITY_DN67987_c0_g1_i1:354-1004(-)